MKADLQAALALIFEGIERLKRIAPHRRFTIDGRLVGDIGEIIAAAEFDIRLDDVSQARHDGVTGDGRMVQIKATFQDSLTVRHEPELYLGLKLYPDGRYEVVFNGPGSVLTHAFDHRKGYGNALLSFPVKRLRVLSENVNDGDRVPKRVTV